MPRYIIKDGKKKKVAEYDTSLMLTLRDVLPNDADLAKKFLVKSKDAPKGKIRDLYGTQDNSALVRKMFVSLLKVILTEIAMGYGQFIVPTTGNSYPSIYMGWLDEGVTKSKRKQNRLSHFDLMQTDYKVPYVKYSLGSRTNRQHLNIYLNKKLYAHLIERANSGQPFSKAPRDIDYFLPYLYEEFSYIKEDKIRPLMLHCFSRLQWHLRRGEEVRIIDGDGEIRFFRPLGKIHDEVMTQVMRTRLTRERNKKNESIS